MKTTILSWFEKCHAPSPLQVEMKSLLLAANLAHQYALKKALLVSDALAIVNSTNLVVDLLWEIKSLALDI